MTNILVQDMQLKRSSVHGNRAWKWTAPNDTDFYLVKTQHGNGWVWYRCDSDPISSQIFKTLEDLKQHLATAFSEE